MISRFTLKCQEKASECLKYGKTIWQPGLCPDPIGGAYSAVFQNFFFYSRYPVDSYTDIVIAINYVW